MAATNGGMPFRHLCTKRLASLIAATGNSYRGWAATRILRSVSGKTQVALFAVKRGGYSKL